MHLSKTASLQNFSYLLIILCILLLTLKIGFLLGIEEAEKKQEELLQTVSSLNNRLKTTEQLLNEMHWIITFERGLYIVDVTSYYDSLRLAIGG